MERRYAGCETLDAARMQVLQQRREQNMACEKPLFPIRPLVKESELAFRVKYQPLDEFLKEQKLDESHYLLITTAGSYRAALEKLSGSYAVIYVRDSKEDTLHGLQKLYDDTVAEQAADSLLDAAQKQPSRTLRTDEFDAVLCLGGGVAMDAGKYISDQVVHAPLYTAPTALSVNAAFCYKAAIREKDPYTEGAYNVVYKFYGLPQAICIDLDIITGRKILAAGQDAQSVASWNMLRELNAAGAGDLLSILTATFDWRINSLVARGMEALDPNDKDAVTKLEKPFSQEVCDGAMELLALLSENAERIRGGTAEGAEFLARAYHWIAEQSWLMQHTMWESASEHGMFDCFENVAGTELTHGLVVALSVFFMSSLQQNQHLRASEMVHRLGLDISLANLAINKADNEKIRPATLFRCLMNLRQYIDQIAYRYTIISAKPITGQWVLSVLDEYYSTVYGDLLSQYENRETLYGGTSPLAQAERLRLERIHNRLAADLAAHQVAMQAAAAAEAAEREKLAGELSAPDLNAQKNAALHERILQAKVQAYGASLESAAR